jgi:glyoxylase-like metal-dependent hydrolase (beta-lactamase superfamily II)
MTATLISPRLIPASALFAFFVSTAFAQQNFDAVQIETTQVSENVYMLVGSGGNIGVIAGEDGTFIIDDQFAPLTDKINAAIAGISDQPVGFVMNTHWHADHTGGNENMGKAGALIVAHHNVRERMHADQITKLAADNTRLAEAALPVITFAEDVTFYLNGEEIHAFHVDNAHTDGDAIIHFRNANVFHMGDTFFSGRVPYIDLDSGGSVDGIIQAANHVLMLADENTKIIPGHGPLSTPEDLETYRDMLMQLRSRIQLLVSQDKTLEEVRAENPTEGYDEWGAGFINNDRIVEIMFNDLSSKE